MKSPKNSIPNQAEEEISEKRTSVLGYVLLTLMIIFIITAGNTVFYDLSRIPDTPIPLSDCTRNLSWQFFSYGSEKCEQHPNFTETDVQFGLDSLYTILLPRFVAKKQTEEALEDAQRVETDLKETRLFLYQKYGISLQEDAQLSKQELNRVLSSAKSAEQIREIEAKLAKHQIRLDSLKRALFEIEAEVKPVFDQFRNQVELATDFVQREEVWKKWFEFLLKLLFILPLMASSIYFYIKLKAKNSPYTIILTALVSAFSFLFLQISSVLLYHVVPHKWLGQILQWLISIPFFSYLVYYLMVITIILFFGGMVFYIQKRVFNPVVVARRRLREHKCPSCSFPIEAGQKFCTDCGKQIRVECSSCGSLRYPDLTYCSNCGCK